MSHRQNYDMKIWTKLNVLYVNNLDSQKISCIKKHLFLLYKTREELAGFFALEETLMTTQ